MSEMENGVNSGALIEAIESGDSAQILNALQETGGDDLVKKVINAGRSNVRNAKTAEKQVYLTSRQAQVVALKTSLETQVQDIFTELGEDETVRLDLSVVIGPDTTESMSKLRYSPVKQPVVLSPDNIEAPIEDFRTFGKRTYTKKAADTE